MSEDTYRWTEKRYRLESIWESLRGVIVTITWRHIDPREEPWGRYRVLDADSEWIKLQGVDQPKGFDEIGMKIADEYIGGPIVVRLSDIEMAEVAE